MGELQPYNKLGSSPTLVLVVDDGSHTFQVEVLALPRVGERLNVDLEGESRDFIVKEVRHFGLGYTGPSRVLPGIVCFVTPNITLVPEPKTE